MFCLKPWNCLLIFIIVLIVPLRSLNPSESDSENGNNEFSYIVKDDFGNDFSHNAHTNGDVVTGEYRTLLPDARVQIVRYQANWKNGYTAHVAHIAEGSSTGLIPESVLKITTPRSTPPPSKLLTTPTGRYSSPVQTKQLLKTAIPRRAPLTTPKLPFSRPQSSFVDEIEAAQAIASSQLACLDGTVGGKCNPKSKIGQSDKRIIMSEGYSYPKPKIEFNS